MSKACCCLLTSAVLLLAAHGASADENESSDSGHALTVDEVLQQWERASSQIHTFDALIRRYVYDHGSHIERRSGGHFYFQAPRQGRLEFTHLELLPESVSMQKDDQGQPYELQTDRPRSWIWTDDRLIAIDPVDKSYLIEPIPHDDERQQIRSAGLFQGLARTFSRPQNFLPLVVDVDAEQVRQSFELTIRQQTDANVWLVARPRVAHLAARMRSADVILDRKTCLPMVVKYTHPSGKLESVYVFESVSVNRPLSGSDNPLQVDLEGYQPIRDGEKILQPVKADRQEDADP